MKKEKKRKTLYIFSYGIRPSQITLETLSALKKCDLVFSHSLEGGAGDFISGACKEFRMLRELDQRQTVNSVKKAFLTRGTVGFLTYGNPFFLNATTALINMEMKRAGICVRVMPAVSSFDAIINLMDLNKYSASGLRLVELATVMEDVPLTPEMDTLFFVVGELNLKENDRHRERFFEKLKKTYPGAQAAVLINCACIGDESGRLIKTSVARLKKAFGRADKVTTLFIPAVTNNAIGHRQKGCHKL
ncbi:MAG: SAM-dependent methyltransferase [Elusimicrobia bacterium]|nr:SAM-dependent methyltransferase [Elusimicrobiota bacterium]